MFTETATTKPKSPPQAAGAGAWADPARAWATYEPDAERPWDLRRAGHLYRRAAFGATWDQLQAAIAEGPQRTVDKLLRPGGAPAAFNRVFDGQESSVVDPDSASGETVGEWWLRRMIQTPHPLLEKMTLFWHNHFATSIVKVQNARMMQQYLSLLRSQALGSFKPLLAAIVNDPATLDSLDLGVNTRAHPNENMARALLERFTLGPGKCSERDIREVSRAFTGWSMLRHQRRYVARDHDDGPKTILGQTGNWSGEDVVRILLQQPATPRFVVREVYRWLVSETAEPSDALLAPLAESFAKDYDVAKLVETILRSNLFFSPAAYRQRIKSPIEFALGIVRPMETLLPTAPLVRDLAALGQDPCQPPTIQGWEGGKVWITTATLVARSNLAVALLSGRDPYGVKVDPLAVARRHGRAAAEAAPQFFVDLLLQGDVSPALRDALAKLPSAGDTAAQAPALRSLVAQIVALPEFQLA